MAFPPQFLDEIRARVSLSAIIGRRVRLIRRGREHVALCPFHSEKTPSFTVSEDKGFFHCFGCGAHGDVIGFVMRSENLSFLEALERLAQEAGLEVPKRSPAEREREREQLSLYGIVEAACAWFEAQLKGPAGEAARDYLKHRGLTDETIARFRLGFAPDDRRALKAGLGEQGISESMMITTGLLIQPEDGGETYDRFRNRIIFPISDRRGRAIAFGGRAMGEARAKYLNSPDTPLFHKGAVLYGLAQARDTARKWRRAVVVEGYMDVLALHQAGIECAVAPLGTALTELQMEEVWRLAPEPVLCFDGDAAGERAAFRAAERSLPRLKVDRTLRFAPLPLGEDPDSLLAKRGVAEVKELLRRARPLGDSLWAIAVGGGALDTPERQAASEHRFAEMVDRIPDRNLRFYFNRQFRDRIWQALRGRKVDGGSKRARKTGVTRPERALERDVAERPDHVERTVLQTVLNFPELISEFRDVLARLEIETARYGRLRDFLIDRETQGLEPGRIVDREVFADAGLQDVVEELTGETASWSTYVSWAASNVHSRIDEARAVLGEILDLRIWLAELDRDKGEAAQALAEDMTEETFERLSSAIQTKQAEFDNLKLEADKAQIPDRTAELAEVLERHGGPAEGSPRPRRKIEPEGEEEIPWNW